MRVGIVGLGNMGKVFVDRLTGGGHEVAVWNRSPGPAKAAGEKGARVAATPSELARLSDVIITVVTDEKVYPAIFEGPDGLLAGGKGKLFVEMSTVAPPAHVALEKQVKDAGARFIECPVGGSVGVARDGKLLGFAGGAKDDVDATRPVLDLLCRRVDHVGPVGAGATLKLAINLPLLVYWQAFGEALALCEPYKFDPEWLVQLFSESTGGTNALKVRGPAIVTALSGGEPPMSAALDTLAKDLNLMIETATSQGHPSPLVERTRQAFNAAQSAGLGGMDCTSYPVYWARKGKSA